MGSAILVYLGSRRFIPLLIGENPADITKDKSLGKSNSTMDRNNVHFTVENQVGLIIHLQKVALGLSWYVYWSDSHLSPDWVDSFSSNGRLGIVVKAHPCVIESVHLDRGEFGRSGRYRPGGY